MYLLGREIAKDPEFAVSFVFNGPLAKASGQEVKLVHQPLIRHGIPYVSRWLNQRRRIATYPRGGRTIVFATLALAAPRLIEDARLAGAKSVFRVASDADVTEPLGACAERQQEALGAISRADRVVVQTEWQRQALLSSRDKESVVIRKGMPIPESPPDFAQKRGALWVASAQPLKQPWYFLDLALEFPGEQFTMVMPHSNPALEDYVARRARSIPNLTLVDRQVPFSEVQCHFDRAQIFAYTSEFSTHPENTILQACVGGCAILSLRLDPDQMFSERDAGVCAHDYIQLGDELGKLFGNPAECRRLGERAFEFAASDYDLDRMVYEYKQLFRGLV